MYNLMDLFCAFAAGMSLIMIFISMAGENTNGAIQYVFLFILNAVLALW